MQDEAVKAARKSVDLTTNQYKAGTVSYLNVITAQSIALTNEITRSRSVAGGWRRRSCLSRPSAALVGGRSPIPRRP